MKNIDWKSDVVPHIIIILVFLALTFSLLGPLLQGKVLYQGDIVQFKGMANEITEYTEKTGRQPLWTNRPFAGMPSFLIHTRHNTNVLKYVDQIMSFGMNNNLRPAKILFLLFLGFYLGGLIFGINKWLSAIGAAAFALSTYFIVSLEAGHNTKILCTAYMLPVIASMFFAYRKNRWWGALMLAVFLGLNLNANHVQITFYTLLTGLVIFIIEMINAIRSKSMNGFFKTTAFLAVGAVMALGLNSGRLMTIYFHSQETTRGAATEITSLKKESAGSGLDYNYAMAWSYGIKESLTILIPNFAGGASSGELSTSSNVYEALVDKRVPKKQASDIIKNMPLYYGDLTITGGPVYFGAVICFLFLLAMLLLPWKYKLWGLVAFLLALMLGWGQNFFLAKVFYNYFPLFNKFRTPMMVLTIGGMLFPLFGMMGLNQLFKSSEDRKKLLRYTYIAAGVTAGICLIAAMLSSMFWNFSSPRDTQLIMGYNQAMPGLGNDVVDALRDDRQSLLRMDALRSMLLILLAAGGIWLYIKEKIKKEYVIAIMAVLVLGDLWLVAKRYIDQDDFSSQRDLEKAFRLLPREKKIDENKNLFRVLNATRSLDSDGITPYTYNSIGGYSAAKLRRFQDVLDGYLTKGNQRVLNMLNTKYIIDSDGTMKLNNNACGNGWLAQSITWVNTPDQAFERLNALDACGEAVLDEKYRATVSQKNPNGNGSVQMVKNELDQIEYTVEANGNQLAVFSEMFYKAGGGWKATVNGKDTEVIRANYLLRAIEVPSGKSKVVFTFAPSFYKNGEILSGIFSLLLIALTAFLFMRSRKGLLPANHEPVVD